MPSSNVKVDSKKRSNKKLFHHKKRVCLGIVDIINDWNFCYFANYRIKYRMWLEVSLIRGWPQHGNKYAVKYCLIASARTTRNNYAATHFIYCWIHVRMVFFLIQPFSANSAESKAAISCGETVLSKRIIKFVLLAHIFHHFALFVVQLWRVGWYPNRKTCLLIV